MQAHFVNLAIASALAVHLATVVAIQSKAATASNGEASRPLDEDRATVFNRMSVSPVDPQIVYGGHKGLEVSRDGGVTWSVVGSPPGKIIDLATSALEVNTVYTATQAGLFISKDGGESWQPLLEGEPVSMIEVTREGFIYAFVIGRGVVGSAEEPLKFADIEFDFEGLAWYWHVLGDPRLWDQKP
jgi:hypothetical protein